MTTRILQSEPANFYKRALSVADGIDSRLTLSLATSGKVFDTGDRFRVYNGTANSQTMTVGPDGATTTLKTVAALGGSPGARDVVLLGDSRTAASGDSYVKLLKDNIGTDCTLLGTQGSGSYLHEGHSGQDYEWFADNASSPLTSGAGTLDMPGYFTTIGATPDIISMWSDVNAFITGVTSGSISEANWQSAVDTELDHLQDIIDATHAVSAAIKVIIHTAPAGPSPTSIWTGGGYTEPGRRLYRRFVDVLNAEYVSRWGSSEGSNIYLCPTHLVLDPLRHWQSPDPIHPIVGATSGHGAIEKTLRALLSDIW